MPPSTVGDAKSNTACFAEPVTPTEFADAGSLPVPPPLAAPFAAMLAAWEEEVGRTGSDAPEEGSVASGGGGGCSPRSQ